MEEQITESLERNSWDVTAAREWMLSNFGLQTPPLAKFEQIRRDAATAKWREVVRSVGMAELQTRFAEAQLMMGDLNEYLSDEAQESIISEERTRDRKHKPQPFMGLSGDQ